jgi:GTP-binding protein HflX
MRLENQSTIDQQTEIGERAVLVAVHIGQETGAVAESERSLDELDELVRAAGAEVVGRMIQKRVSADPASLIGRGKLSELRDACAALAANLIVFDDELTGSQLRNIGEATDCKVIDRTLLILDIFARRARSREGKLQVELAQQQYRYSRLTGLGQSLSRLGGGIGTRGPGETKLESDRRHINRRILYLRQALAEVAKQRDRVRQHRQERELLTFAVVGYTNAGKSTLINRLCASDLLTADQVFATLDPSVRRLLLPDGSIVLLVDTVGLISRLPHHLVESFHATLEELTSADGIIEVIDASAADAAARMAVVEDLLTQLGAAAKPRFFVFNKMDRVPVPEAADPDQIDQDPPGLAPTLTAHLPSGNRQQAFLVSALMGTGLAALQQALADHAAASQLSLDILLPYSEAGLLDIVRRHGRVDQVDYLAEGILAKIHIRYSHFAPLRAYVQLAERDEKQ